MGELEIFATRIKELRDSLKMTQKDFCEHIGIKQQTLSGYERGIMKPPLDIAKGIAEKCNVSIDWLCGLTDKRTYNDEIETFGDAIRLLLKLEKKLDISVSFELLKTDIDFTSRTFLASISFGNIKMQDFINEWEKMKDLHDKTMIDDDVYNLWIEKTLKKYDAYPAIGDDWKLPPPTPQG